MTAEIAILNRTAVALAADSIVTLSGPSGSKTYDSAEKIFELSRFRPIGLMVYNNAELIRIPVEILARDFREVISDEFAELIQVWPRFQRFLLSVCVESELDDTMTEFEALIGSEVERLTLQFINAAVTRFGKGSEESVGELLRLLKESIDATIERAKDDRLAGFLDETSIDQFADHYGARTKALVEKRLVPVVQGLTGDEFDGEMWRKFDELAFALVRSRKKSSAFTGLVFAGFGRNDMFSSLHAVEIDGIYFGEVRVIGENEVDIDRHGDTSAIVPFAQKDMPERFMFGIDQAFEDQLSKIAKNLIVQVLEQATGSFSRDQSEEIEAAAMERFRRSISSQKEVSEKELKSIVNHLSKRELGEVAYSLVELTSRKRRYSRGMETVGGPIDVAILTRNEGFIWVRRKRYFDVEMNPAYLERLKHTMQKVGGHNEREETQTETDSGTGGDAGCTDRVIA